MIILISPAKTLDFSESAIKVSPTKRIFKEETAELAKVLQKLQLNDLKKLMSISDKLANQVASFIKSYQNIDSKEKSKPAILAFKGDVYQAFDFEKYKAADFKVLQDRVRILSGFYGLLCPFDLMQPYRLEMSTRLVNPKGKNLYQFWSDLVSLQLNKDAKKLSAKFIINLASEEYFKVITPKLNIPVIKVDFKERKGNSYKIVGISAKKARGEMTDYIVLNRINDLNGIKKFTRQNYSFNAKLSTTNNLVFTRGDSAS